MSFIRICHTCTAETECELCQGCYYYFCGYCDEEHDCQMTALRDDLLEEMLLDEIDENTDIEN